MDYKTQNYITLLRKYCIERINEAWNKNIYHNLPKNIFEILIELESFKDDDRYSVEEVRELLEIVEINPKSKNVVGDTQELKNFKDFLKGIRNEMLENVEPIFHRYYLTREEGNKFEKIFFNEWEISWKEYWYPLNCTEIRRKDVIAFQSRHFENEIKLDDICRILKDRCVEYIYEIKEDGTIKEIDLSIFDPSYDGNEGFWTSKQIDWVIYASHESSITIGGEWFIEEIKKIWNNWSERIWTSPFYK